MGTVSKRGQQSFSLFGKARGAVLGLLYGRPDESFYVRQIARAAGAGHGAVQRELRVLSGASLIERYERDNQVYYRANRRCSIFQELRSLMAKTAGLANIMADALTPFEEDVTLAFIYGSQADGTATSTSDIDIMVVGNVDEMDLHRAIAKVEGQLGRTINYSLMKEREFHRRLKEEGGFVQRVVAGPKIIIRGSIDEV